MEKLAATIVVSRPTLSRYFLHHAMGTGYMVIAECAQSNTQLAARVRRHCGGNIVAETFLSTCVDGILVAPLGNDEEQHGLASVAQRRGGLLIAGNDDNPRCAFRAPAVTTVSRDNIGIGQAAMAHLIEKISVDCMPCDQMVKLFDGAPQVREST